jgi:phage recombination protein Bet
MKNEISKLIQFNNEQIVLIKSQIAKDCTDDELQLFLYQCKQTGLNPLTRQIYAIKRGNKMTIQTSIDGFRVIAERSGNYAGQDEPIWENDEKGFPIKCTVRVYKFTPNFEQRYCAGVGVAHFKEYYPNPQMLQKTMPHTMIAKVAEALALRKAFPQDLSGLYTGDEIADAPKEIVPNKFFKEPEGSMKNLSDIAGEELKASAEEQRLNKLKEALAKMQTKEEITDYLNKKYQGKTRLEILQSMSEANAEKAMQLIADANADLWIEDDIADDIEEEMEVKND